MRGAARTRPRRTRIDGRLVAGSALFGAGWAAAGMCPGPALANAALPALGGGAAAAAAAPFCGAMALGMRAVDALDDARRRRTA
jgi:hypothetical protein